MRLFLCSMLAQPFCIHSTIILFAIEVEHLDTTTTTCSKNQNAPTVKNRGRRIVV
jgi:hypothetical protein